MNKKNNLINYQQNPNMRRFFQNMGDMLPNNIAGN